MVLDSTITTHVSEKTIGGSQMPIIWHMDDLKVSLKNPSEVTKFACYFQSIYGENLTAKHGKNDYLGIYLDFPRRGVSRF